MSESLVEVKEGASLDPKLYNCVFCKDRAKQLFGATIKKKPRGDVIRHFGVCEKHLDKINALLSGEFDIDLILAESRKTKNSKVINLRG